MTENVAALGRTPQLLRVGALREALEPRTSIVAPSALPPEPPATARASEPEGLSTAAAAKDAGAALL
jgi:hypothetical protein